MQYTEIVLVVKNKSFTGKIVIFYFFFAQNIDRTASVRRFAEAVLMGTHNLCFGAKIRKIGVPPHTPVLLYKSIKGYTFHGHVFLMETEKN